MRQADRPAFRQIGIEADRQALGQAGVLAKEKSLYWEKKARWVGPGDLVLFLNVEDQGADLDVCRGSRLGPRLVLHHNTPT